jgi:3-phenylpropionate/trans-cinnamate dioxygenase ferredoxin reductase component
MSEQTLVVVGAGHVAASAARALRRRGFAGPVVLVGDEPVGPYQRP